MDWLEETKEAEIVSVKKGQQKKREATSMDPHFSKPPKLQKDRPEHTPNKRIGVAHNYTGFRA